MTDHDVATRTDDRTHAATDAVASPAPTSHVEFLRAEFPDWDFEIGATEGWDGEVRELWIARRDGDHPQAELTAAKLHTRLSGYLEREAAKRALRN